MYNNDYNIVYSIPNSHIRSISRAHFKQVVYMTFVYFHQQKQQCCSSVEIFAVVHYTIILAQLNVKGKRERQAATNTKCILELNCVTRASFQLL